LMNWKELVRTKLVAGNQALMFAKLLGTELRVEG